MMHQSGTQHSMDQREGSHSEEATDVCGFDNLGLTNEDTQLSSNVTCRLGGLGPNMAMTNLSAKTLLN
eukprot:3984181-Amphidinium_carterae.1